MLSKITKTLVYPRLYQGLSQALPRFIPGFTKVYPRLYQGLSQALPRFIPGFTKVYPRLYQGLSQALPRFIPGFTKVYPRLTELKLSPSGDVVVFLDSHIEATPGWVEPILDRISRNRRTVIQPNIPAIDFNTFEFIDDVQDTPSAHSVMGRWWGIWYHRDHIKIKSSENNIIRGHPWKTYVRVGCQEKADTFGHGGGRGSSKSGRPYLFQNLSI